MPAAHPLLLQARFLSAAARLPQAPPDSGREVAFAGRSNAGKSSAINAICQQNRLARISRTPGRTQQLIFFELDASRRLVDLPGYGYAKVSLAIKAGWQQLMADYLQRRQALVGLVVVMDIRHPLTEIDQRMLAWGESAGTPMLVLLTKADKLSRSAVATTVLRVQRALPDSFTILGFSARDRQGLEAARDWLAKQLNTIGAEPRREVC